MVSRAEIVAKNNAKPETKARKHEWYLKHRTRVIEASRQWAINNPAKRKESALKHAHKMNFGGNRPQKVSRCELCGSDYRLHVHHRDGNNGRNGKPANHSPDNLIVLCNPCHTRIHHPRKELIKI